MISRFHRFVNMIAESDQILQKMTIQTKNPLESNLSSIQEAFSLSAFSALYRHILCCFILSNCLPCFFLVCLKSLRSILELWLSAALASSAGFTVSMLPILPVSRSALSVLYCFTSAASCSVFLWRHPHSLRY